MSQVLTCVDECAHPAEARSALKGGGELCTACQTRLDEAPEAAHPMTGRKWGDEPDPLPARPTILVASTDPHINHDGEAARAYAPKPALTVAKSAFAGGWRYEFTYAAATVPTKGEPGKRGHKPAHTLHTVALRLARDTHHPAGAVDALIERGYVIWAREDEIGGTEGKWAFSSAQINGRQYGSRQLGERLLLQGQALLDELTATPELPATPPAPVASTPVPVAPILPGTWGALHVGDTITGNNGQPYLVRSIERTGTWVAAGVPEVVVEIGPAFDYPAPYAGEPLTIRQPANAAIVAASHGDHAPVVEVLDTFAAAGLSVQPIEERASTVDQFSDPTPAPVSTQRSEPPFGKYRWYKLPHPITGDTEAIWPRVSTIMKTHADSEGLTDWQIRMAMKGLAVSPDLIAMVASLDIENDKSKFSEAAKEAHARAGSKKGANFGTAVDRFTERLDAGESITSMGVPEGLRADVEAYARTLRDHGLEVLPQFTQRTTVNATHEYAGTWDRVVRRVSTGELFMLDLKSNKPDAKTGGMSNYSWLEYISQLAAYAYGEHMCTLDFTAYEPMPEVSKAKGLILHLPSGKGRGELYGVRLERGWHNFVRSIETRKDRTEAKTGWSWLIERPVTAAPTPAPAPEPVEAVAPTPALAVHDHVARDIAAATTIEQLGNVARNAIEAGVWTDTLAEIALSHDAEIRARTAPDHAALAALWAELNAAGRWTLHVQALADARAAELAQLVAA